MNANDNRKDIRRQLRNNMTPAERLMWKYLKNHQLHGIRFLRQYSVGSYILDFYAPAIKLCIELDGDGHFTSEGYEHDIHRDAFLRSNGIYIIRLENEIVWKQPDNVIAAIEEKIIQLSEQ